jgi:hypothetical protein
MEIVEHHRHSCAGCHKSRIDIPWISIDPDDSGLDNWCPMGCNVCVFNQYMHFRPYAIFGNLPSRRAYWISLFESDSPGVAPAFFQDDLYSNIMLRVIGFTVQLLLGLLLSYFGEHCFDKVVLVLRNGDEYAIFVLGSVALLPLAFNGNDIDFAFGLVVFLSPVVLYIIFAGVMWLFTCSAVLLVSHILSPMLGLFSHSDWSVIMSNSELGCSVLVFLCLCKFFSFFSAGSTDGYMSVKTSRSLDSSRSRRMPTYWISFSGRYNSLAAYSPPLPWRTSACACSAWPKGCGLPEKELGDKLLTKWSYRLSCKYEIMRF